MTSRYQGRKPGIDISRVSTDSYSNIIVHHRNSLLPDDGIYKVFKPDIDTASKPNLNITKCANYLFTYPLNVNTNTPSYNFAYKYYGTHKTQPMDIKKN